MKLTATGIKHLKAAEGKEFSKFADGEGLCLLVKANGSKLWRFRYRYDGKPKELALGSFKDVSLQQARELTRKARELIASGVDPADDKKEVQLQRKIAESNTFEAITREYLKFNS
ncbi:MAG: hypothetical protein Kow0029_07780 [Candidatus Rifleibacteriota bacterium]